jgi:hypothetical protein
MELIFVLGSYLIILVLAIAFIKIIIGSLEFIWNNVFVLLGLILLIVLLIGY